MNTRGEDADGYIGMRAKLRSVAAGAMQRRARARRLPVDPDLVALTFELFEAQGARCGLTGIGSTSAWSAAVRRGDLLLHLCTGSTPRPGTRATTPA